MLDAMSRNWWIWVLRGVFALIFGALAIIVPGITLTVLIFMFGAYVLLDGIFGIVAALSERSSHDRWWVNLLEGIVGVIIGVLTFILPGITGLVLLYMIAFWAILTGIIELASAFRLREEISGEWLLGLSGILSIVFGILLVLSPVSGALAVAWLIGLYAIIFGGTMIALGFRLRNMDEQTLSATS